MSLVEWLAALALTTLCSGRPAAHDSGTTHYYTFWRAVNSRLMPRATSLQNSVRSLILDYCSLDVAKRMYDDIKFPTFPSLKTLQKENRISERPFLKSLLKETVIELYGYERQLDKELKKNCNNHKTKPTESSCDQLRRMLTNVKTLADELKTQVYSYFNASFNKNPKRSGMEKTLCTKRLQKPNRRIILLYGLYAHLHETYSALQFSLELSKPHP
ncbi:uncharacterized protein LOC121384654 isoform X2 [Gigantopelta aegis]|nr:uncharacterized protein LOC121384654 isoform X2 [Gigantopelta aegis]